MQPSGPSRGSRVVASSLFVLALALQATPASAQTDEQRAGARSLATEGVAAFNEGRYQDAVDLLTKAQSLVKAPPHLLFLARSQVKLGRLVSAREAYLKIIKEQLPANAPEAFREAQVAAEAELGPIEPKIGRLTIRVEGAAKTEDLEVKVDGSPLAAVLIGAPQPMDPGEHKIELTAVGMKPQSQIIKLGEGETGAVALKLEPDPNYVPPAEPTVGAAAVGAEGPVGGGKDTGPSDSKKGLRIGAYSAFGLGAVGLGVGTVFLLQKGSKSSEADDLCNVNAQGMCAAGTEEKVTSLDDEAVSAGKLSFVGFAVGGAGIAAGVTMLILSMRASSQAGLDDHRPSIRPWVGLNSAGLSGQF